MQKAEETTSMSFENSNNSDQEAAEVAIFESESTKRAHQPNLENQFPMTYRDGSKKSESKEESSHGGVDAWRDSSSPRNTPWIIEGNAIASTPLKGTVADCCSGRERLKRHRVEVAGRVWIPEMWGQEGLLKDWTDCTAIDFSLAKSSIMSARASLMEEARRANSNRFRIENRC